MDLKEVTIGQIMLKAACKIVNDGTADLNKVSNEQKEIEKTRQTMLDYFCSTSQRKEIEKELRRLINSTLCMYSAVK